MDFEMENRNTCQSDHSSFALIQSIGVDSDKEIDIEVTLAHLFTLYSRSVILFPPSDNHTSVRIDEISTSIIIPTNNEAFSGAFSANEYVPDIWAE